MDYNFGEPFLARLVSKDENTFAKIMELMEKEKYSFLEVMYLAVPLVHLRSLWMYLRHCGYLRLASGTRNQRQDPGGYEQAVA